MQLGRYIVETHCHGQRHAVRVQSTEEDSDYKTLPDQMKLAVPGDEADEDDAVIVYDNSERVVRDMDTYGVDVCVLLSSFGMTNEINRQIIERHPDKFIAAAAPVQTKKKALRGEEDWTWDAVAEELDEWLQRDGFRMTGEGIRCDPTRTDPIPWSERKEQLRYVFDVAAKHEVPVRWHTGYVSGYGGTHGLFNILPDWSDPTLASQMKAEYPEVPIIFDHGGMQAGWQESYVDDVCQVASTFDDVYIEIGLYWAELMAKPFNDPNIGVDQLLWGTDWGASMVEHHQPNEEPQSYWEQISERGLPAHQPDYWGSSFRKLLKFSMDRDIPQDTLNLILGGNAARLFDLDIPDHRMFEQYVDV